MRPSPNFGPLFAAEFSEGLTPLERRGLEGKREEDRGDGGGWEGFGDGEQMDDFADEQSLRLQVRCLRSVSLVG